MKTARFSQVVDQCGAPETYTLWTEPKKDAQFQKALKQHRIMMVHQENAGTTADFGLVGFDGKVAGELLVFPKSLKSFEGRKVIGLKYELLNGAPPLSKADDNAPTRKGTKERSRPAQRKKPVASDNSDQKTKIVPFTPKPEEIPKRETPVQPAKPVKAVKEPKRDNDVSPPPEKAANPASPVGAQKPEVAISLVSKKLRLAMKALQAGKAVQSYQMLEQLDRDISK